MSVEIRVLVAGLLWILCACPVASRPASGPSGEPGAPTTLHVSTQPLTATGVYVRPSRTQPSVNGTTVAPTLNGDWVRVADKTPVDLTFPLPNVPIVPNYDFQAVNRGWFALYEGQVDSVQPGMRADAITIFLVARPNPWPLAAVALLAISAVILIAVLHRRSRRLTVRLERTLDEMATMAEGKAMDMEVPRLIGRTVRGHTGEEYRTLRFLGAGNMGAVFEVAAGAPDAERRRWAMKIPFRSIVLDPDARRRFVREAEICRKLPHPGLVQILDWGTHDDEDETRAMEGALEKWPFLVMEMMEGRTLRDVIDENKNGLSVARTVEFLAQMMRALKAMHDAGVVHRDLKPENIWVTPSGKVKIGDFGIAGKRESHSVTATGEILGTPLYMSPEHLEAQKTTPASDVYSMGVVAYEMLCGVTPFEAESVVGVLNRMLTEEPHRPSESRGDVPPALETLIMSMMSRDASRRPTAQRVLAALGTLGVRGGA